MWIRFTKPAPGWAYFEGTLADLPEPEAERLVAQGYAVPCAGQEPESQLPADFPARKALEREGLYTLEKVRDAIPVLHEIRGIGSRTVEDIKNRLSKQ